MTNLYKAWGLVPRTVDEEGGRPTMSGSEHALLLSWEPWDFRCACTDTRDSMGPVVSTPASLFGIHAL